MIQVLGAGPVGNLYQPDILWRRGCIDSFSELVPNPSSYEKTYQLLRIPLGDGRFELVSASLVEIEYY